MSDKRPCHHNWPKDHPHPCVHCKRAHRGGRTYERHAMPAALEEHDRAHIEALPDDHPLKPLAAARRRGTT